EPHGLFRGELLVLWIGQLEPVGRTLKRHVGNKGRHDHDRGAIARPRLQPSLAQDCISIGAADEQVAEEHNQVTFDIRRLKARVETPAERVITMRESDYGTVKSDRLVILLNAASISCHVTCAYLACDKRERHSELHFTAKTEGVRDILIL